MNTKSIFKSAAATLALLSLSQPALAQTQQCVEQADLKDTTIYVMPILADAVNEKCAGELSPDGFFATQSEAFLEPYIARQDAAWPGALNLLKVFGSAREGGSEMSSLMGALPEDTMRPFVDAIILSMVGKEIKTKDCGKIERGVELLAPLPPENVGGLVTFLMDVADVKKPELCPYRGDE